MKTLNVNVQYGDDKHLFQGNKREIVVQIARLCSLDLSDIDFYVKEKNNMRLISANEIGDLMNLTVIKKGTNPQRQLRSSFLGEPSTKKTSVEKIMFKLRSNGALTGAERKHLLEMLETDIDRNSFAEKRKHEGDINGHGIKVKMVAKRIQVSCRTGELKEACTQTESDGQNYNDNDSQDLQPTDSENFRTEEASVRLKKLSILHPKSKKIKEEIKNLMDATFDIRRKFIIMETPPVVAVKEKYPALFLVDEVKNELERICYAGKYEEFMSNIDKYSDIILTLCDQSSDIFYRTKRSVERAQTYEQKKYAKSVGSILLLPSLLKEKQEFLQLLDNECYGGMFPYIKASLHSLKDLFFDNILFTIITEEKELCEASNFKEAILCLMTSFFIFNISYPENCAQTFIVFERIYLCANDTPDLIISNSTQQMIKLLKLKAA